MKKFTKIALIVILITGVVGGCLAGAGLVFGGSLRSINGDFGNSRLYHFLCRINRELDDDYWDIEDDFDDYHHGRNALEQSAKTEAGSVSQSFPTSEVESLDIEMYMGKIEIRTVQEDEIRISGLSSSDLIEFDAEDREIVLEKNYNDYGVQETVVIEIPENKIFSSCDIHVDAGQLAVAGKLFVRECDLSLTSGEVKMDLLDAQETDIEVVSGNVDITHTGKLDDYAVFAQCARGHLLLNGEEHAGTTNARYGTEGSLKKIDIESSSGSIAVNFENQ